MVLHILSDDKFTEYAIKHFADGGIRSELVVLPSGNGKSFVYSNQVKKINYPSPEFTNLLSKLEDYSGIVLYGIFWPYDEEIIKAAPKDVKIAWYFWGGEIYSHKDVMLSFLAPMTKLLYRLHLIKKGHTLEESLTWQLPLELYKRINYCITSEYEEFEYAKRYTQSNMDFLWYTCYSIEDTVGELVKYRSKGDDVLFCNSAAIENNMFDAALRLARPKFRKILASRKVIMPMGYGPQWVKNIMLKFGHLCFRNFKPIIDFIPRDQYNQRMTDCSTLILPYYSPAGQGNIITALWLGMRVYISEKSIAYQYFKRIDAKVYSFESDFTKYGCEPLTDDLIEHNRNILTNVYGRNNVYKCAKNIIDVLDGTNAAE